MNSILSTDYYIHFNGIAYNALNNYISENKPSKVVVLVDSNTKKYCIDHFTSNLHKGFKIETIEINAGEIHKNIATCIKVWNKLTELNIDRKSLLINLGGGMVTDLGGFVASTYKRGIPFVNIPTTLLSMVDASVGSKTGVDLRTLKNLIGLFSNPEMVVIDTTFLKTMPEREFKSGLAEIIKYGLTYDASVWKQLKEKGQSLEDQLDILIYRSIEIKNEIVLKDLKESNLRKVLNFGHTFGHAVESLFLDHNEKEALTHGEAIGIGMIVEAYASHKLFEFPKDELISLKQLIINLYGKTEIHSKDYQTIFDLMKHDKKNIRSTVNFVLLEAVEKFKLDCQVNEDLLIKGIEFYNS